MTNKYTKPRFVPQDIWDYWCRDEISVGEDGFIYRVLSDSRMKEVYDIYKEDFNLLLDECIKGLNYFISLHDIKSIKNKGFSHWNMVIQDLKILEDNSLIRIKCNKIKEIIEEIEIIRNKLESDHYDDDYFEDTSKLIKAISQSLEIEKSISEENRKLYIESVKKATGNEQYDHDKMVKVWEEVSAKDLHNPNIIALPKKKKDFNKAMAYFCARKIYDILIYCELEIRYSPITTLINVIFEIELDCEDIRKNLSDYRTKVKDFLIPASDD